MEKHNYRSDDDDDDSIFRPRSTLVRYWAVRTARH